MKTNIGKRRTTFLKVHHCNVFLTRIIFTDKQALFEASTEEYTLQVDKFNQTQRRSIEETIPDACRSLQSLFASNGNQWADILDRVVKIESSSAERGNKLLKLVLIMPYY